MPSVLNVGTDDVLISQLKHHPKNANVGNVDAIKESLATNGFFGRVLVNKRTMHILAGNHRVKAAKELGWKKVPVEFVDVDAEAELRILLVDNKTARMGVDDDEKLLEILEELNTYEGGLSGTGYNDDDMSFLQDIINGEDEPLERTSRVSEVEEEEYDARETPWHYMHTKFPSDNDWGIPTLDLNQQARSVMTPIITWGAISRKKQFGGTYNMYTEDRRWENLWKDPTPIVKSGCTALTELNYSTNNDYADIQVLYDIYRKRWLSRYWQSYGIQIYVDLNLATDHFDKALIGVPQGWGAYASRFNVMFDRGTDVMEYQLAVAKERAGSTPLLVMLIGGGGKAKDYCRKNGYIWVPEQIEVNTGKTKNAIIIGEEERENV